MSENKLERFIGVFLGPILPAIGYRLVRGWIATYRAETVPGPKATTVP
jgi:hypothetical protein